MSITASGWKNIKGTADRTCSCGTWKEHWLTFSGKAWPDECTVYGCRALPTLVAHVHNPLVQGERIVPMCNSCNGLDKIFNLNGGVTVVNPDKSETCEK